ncbi:MAG TPA: bifunctional DNA-binding transcriptional regulator/O6-methylguanine-DNA methyltransferase Ada [Longimicrobiaceae bacterium]|nr:bifunctional DNA-binding transcriptional regulator/O6-methylguanine-DNA methyltransferase Ada [Longimicrobiaceae bacterium]
MLTANASDAARDSGVTTPALDDPRYQAVLSRDRTWDGAFVFGVTSTRIYCRPSCPSRRPRADRVRFFSGPDDARQDGFRACKRCRPDEAGVQGGTTSAIVRALIRLDGADETVPLPSLAETAGMSRAHFQRAFTRVVGCSPHEWQAARRADRLRSALVSGAGVTTAAYDAGFESLPSAYAAADRHLGISPGALRRGAPGETVFYTVASCALGQVLVAMTARGVCRVILGDDAAALTAQLEDELHAATLVADDPVVRDVAASVIAAASGATLQRELPLDLRGTAFQQRVWKELTRIPRGETVTYAELARRVGAPGATRAVGTACGANPVAVVVPCHRVLRGDGALGGYRWGTERKAQLLASEQEQRGG